MLTVTYRPEADLYVNNPPEYSESPYYTSRWSSAHLPLVYKILNTKFPVNNTDTLDSFSQVVDRNGFARFDLVGGSYETYIVGEKVIVAGTTNYDGVHEVKEVVSGEFITLDIIYTDTEAGTVQRYYDNYSVLVKLYAGIPAYHPYYNQDPITLIGTYAIAPNSDNLSIIDVRDLVKQKISQNNDLDGTGRPNDLNAWTAFYIEYAETYDEYSTGLPETYTSEYATDYLEGCSNVELQNTDFDSNLNSWNQNGEGNTNAWIWEGRAKAYVGGTGVSFFKTTNLLYQQDLNLKAGIEYTVNLSGSYNEGSYDKSAGYYLFAGTASDRTKYQLFQKVINLVGSINDTITFTLPEDCTTIGFKAKFGDTYPTGYVLINSITFDDVDSESTTCLALIFAHNGTRQFFDLIKNSRPRYGGNMAEYVQNYNVQQVLGKFLTRFEEPVYFAGKYFDISTIIPQSTLDIPYTEDGLILRVTQFDDQEIEASSTDHEIINDGDGVYRLSLNDKLSTSNDHAEIQILRNQTVINFFGAYIKTINNSGIYAGINNIFANYSVSGTPVDISVYKYLGVIFVVDSGSSSDFYKFNGSYFVLVYSTITSVLKVKAFNETNWVAISYNKLIVSYNGVVTEQALLNSNGKGIAGDSINEYYIVTNDPSDQVRLYRYNANVQSGSLLIPEIALVSDVQNVGSLIYIIGSTGGDDVIIRSYTVFAYDVLSQPSIGNPIYKGSFYSSLNGYVSSTSTLYFFNGSTWSEDTDFTAIRASNSDASGITSVSYYGDGLLLVSTLKDIYTKTGSIWNIGASGDYISNTNFFEVDGYYENLELVLPVSESKTIIINNKCSSQEIYISWINTLGNWEFWNFTARKDYEKIIQDFSEVRRNIYSNWPDSFSGETEDDKISIQAYDKVTVRSQFVTKAVLDVIAEIIQSIRVQVWYGTESKITVKVDTDSVKKYSDGDKLYAIEFDIIFPMVQIQQQ